MVTQMLQAEAPHLQAIMLRMVEIRDHHLQDQDPDQLAVDTAVNLAHTLVAQEVAAGVTTMEPTMMQLSHKSMLQDYIDALVRKI